MKATASQVLARQQREFELLMDRKRISITELAALLQVSRMTILRDLALFEKKKLIIHDYGTVVWIGDVQSASAIAPLRQRQYLDALAAAVQDQQVVLINASPMTESAILRLSNRPVTIVTNQLLTRADFLYRPAKIIMTGGELNIINHLRFFSGATAIQTIKAHPADSALIFATGLTERLLTTETLPQSLVDRTMIEYAATNYVFLADNALGKESTFMSVKRERIRHILQAGNKK